MSESKYIYIVYKTTNLVNQKIYVGKHEQPFCFPVIFDGYLGSGLMLKRAIKKYGAENFMRETLHVFYTAKEALEKEAEIVDETFLTRKDVYNISKGGDGCLILFHTTASKQKISDSHKGKKLTEDHKNKISASRKGMIFSEEHKKNISASVKNTVTVKDKHGNQLRVYTSDPRYISGELVHVNVGKKHSDEHKNKISAKSKQFYSNPINREKHSKRLKGIKKPPRTEEHKRNLANANKGKKRNFKIVSCPYCGATMQINHAKRYHFDNCKFKPVK